MDSESKLMAGNHFPWEYIQNRPTKVVKLSTFTTYRGDQDISKPVAGIYGFVFVELPSPDATAEERIINLPIENKSDFRSISIAYYDKGVQEGVNEIVLLYEVRRTLFGGKKPCFHIAIYPEGTWQKFFDKVDEYKVDEFVWPKPLILFQPGNKSAFPITKNIFKKI